MDGVEAVQWVAALWVHVVLAHQAHLTGPACWSLRGRRGPLDGAGDEGQADGPRRRPLVLCQPDANLLDDLLHGHAGQRAAGALHLLEQRQQLGSVALWETIPKLI